MQIGEVTRFIGLPVSTVVEVVKAPPLQSGRHLGGQQARCVNLTNTDVNTITRSFGWKMDSLNDLRQYFPSSTS